jgi:hypothetical protein
MGVAGVLFLSRAGFENDNRTWLALKWLSWSFSFSRFVYNFRTGVGLAIYGAARNHNFRIKRVSDDKNRITFVLLPCY